MLRTVCRLDGGMLARALRWWRDTRGYGKRRAVSEGYGARDREIEAAIRGLSKVYPVRPPWAPFAVFKRANAALWQEAMSAGLKAAAAQRVGERDLVAKLTELARQYHGEGR